MWTMSVSRILNRTYPAGPVSQLGKPTGMVEIRYDTVCYGTCLRVLAIGSRQINLRQEGAYRIGLRLWTVREGNEWGFCTTR